MKESTNLIKYSASSLSSINLCGGCNSKIQNESVSAYSCGHSFHNNCVY